MSIDVVRLDGDRLPVSGDRLVELALVLERVAEIGMSLGVVRLDANRLPKCGDRFVELALLLERVAELEWPSTRSGLVTSLSIFGDCLVELTLFLEACTEVAMSLGEVGFYRMAVCGDRLIKLPL
jgi:hypothetical protein